MSETVRLAATGVDSGWTEEGRHDAERHDPALAVVPDLTVETTVDLTVDTAEEDLLERSLVVVPTDRTGLRDDEGLGWQEDALCAQTDPEAFFPEKGGSTREAKRICVGCDVRSECLDYALAHDERFGIWGGLSERERRRLKRLAG